MGNKTTLFADICKVHIYDGDYKVDLDVKPAQQNSPAYAIIALKADDHSWSIIIYEHRLWVVREAMKVIEGTASDTTEFWKKFRSEGKVQFVKAGDHEHINIFRVDDHAEPLTIRHELRIAQNLSKPEGGVKELWMCESRGTKFAVIAAIWTLAKPATLRPSVVLDKPKDRGRRIAPPPGRAPASSADRPKAPVVASPPEPENKPAEAPEAPAPTDEFAPLAKTITAQA